MGVQQTGQIIHLNGIFQTFKDEASKHIISCPIKSLNVTKGKENKRLEHEGKKSGGLSNSAHEIFREDSKKGDNEGQVQDFWTTSSFSSDAVSRSIFASLMMYFGAQKTNLPFPSIVSYS